MVTIYLDTSAAAKLVLSEPESHSLAEWLQQPDVRGELASSFLLPTELHCAVARRGSKFPVAAARDVLAAIELIDVERADLLAAARSAGLLVVAPN